MEMLYNSDNFAVVHFEIRADRPAINMALIDLADEAPLLSRGGYEIVDKSSRREIYLDGPMAEQFKRGVETLITHEPDEDQVDDFLAGYAALAHHPVVLH
ncbi:MAG: hypothetical protein RL722_3016 [Pseudomonadota bacterium]|jgi:hypothetical protein